jgi:hypothetical protein
MMRALRRPLLQSVLLGLLPIGCATGPGSVSLPHFPLRVSDDSRSLVDADRRPFLLQGDTAWSAIVQLTPSDLETYLDERQRQGFNAILVNLLEHKFSSQTPRWKTRSGVTPFKDALDFDTRNEEYFAEVDRLLSEAGQRGILVLLAPCYLGVGGGDEGWFQEMKRNGVERLNRYGRFLGQRYRNVPNILWVEGGDYTPKTTGNPSELDLVHAVAFGIREAEGNAHLHTAHWQSGTVSSDVPELPWLGVDTLYAYDGVRTDQRSLELFSRDQGVRPFFLIESTYENEHHATPGQLRAQMYQPVLAGGTGFVFGNFPVWHFWRPGDPAWSLGDAGYPGGWTTALQTPGTRSASIAGAFFRSLPWADLQPDLAHRLLKPKASVLPKEASVLAAVTPDGRVAVAYFTRSFTVTVDLSRMSGPIRASWVDPSSATSTPAADPLQNSGLRDFTPPDRNADGTTDWILVLRTN